MAVNPSGPGAPGAPPPPPPPPEGGEGAPTRVLGSGLGARFGKPGQPFGGVMTTEFAVFLATALAVCIAGLFADDIDSITVWILITVLAFGFILSRGLAKHEHRHDDGADHHH